MTNLTDVTCMPLVNAARHIAEPINAKSRQRKRLAAFSHLPMKPFPPTTRIFVTLMEAGKAGNSRIGKQGVEKSKYT